MPFACMKKIQVFISVFNYLLNTSLGILWKHKEWRTDHTETRRSRRLVVSFFTSIANYDYGFYWHFYQDGTIQIEIKLTGILSVTGIKTGQDTEGFGTVVGPNVYGPIHQVPHRIIIHILILLTALLYCSP